MQIAKHKVVEIAYTLKDEQGQIVDSTEGGEPLAYLHGIGAIIPGLESALDGKVAGDRLEVTVPPADGYGERNESLRQDIPRSKFENVGELSLGMQFRVGTDDGPLVITVVDIGDDTVTVDGNHQLAGTTLHFDVSVRNVREATAEEIAHEHAHGAGGHSH